MKKIIQLALKILFINDKKISFNDSFGMQKKIFGKSNITHIFDVGASEGQTALIYSKLFPGAYIHCFEPVKDSYEKLFSIAKKNKNIHPINKAIYSTVGQLDIYLNVSPYTNSILPPEITNSHIDLLTANLGSEIADSITIDQYCRDNNIHHIDILKLDIQGGELSAFKGAIEMLTNKRIKLIYTEIEFLKIYKNQPLLHDLVIFLEKYNYELFGLYNFNYLENGRLAWGDAIFI